MSRVTNRFSTRILQNERSSLRTVKVKLLIFTGRPLFSSKKSSRDGDTLTPKTDPDDDRLTFNKYANISAFPWRKLCVPFRGNLPNPSKTIVDLKSRKFIAIEDPAVWQ